MRTYEKTHPWITFTLDLGQAHYRLWLLLGDAQAKCQYLAGVPLLPSVAEKLYRVFLAKGVLATTAIEGNTLTEEQVMKRIDGELHLPPSKEYLGQEIDNIVEACNTIGKRILEGQPAPLSIDELKEFNRLALEHLPVGEEVIPGKIRSHEVVVGTYKGAPPADCEYLTHRLCEWLAEDFNPPSGYEVGFGILRAILAHLYLAWIHPFADGNGRTARALATLILYLREFDIKRFFALDDYYDSDRNSYYGALDSVDPESLDLTRWLEYFTDGVLISIMKVKQKVLRLSLEKHRKESKGQIPLTERQMNIIEHLQKNGKITAGDVAKMYKITRQAALKELNKLVKLEIIRLQGKGRGAFYVIE